MRKLFLAGLVICLGAAGCATTLPKDRLPALVQGANYVFRATIDKPGASNASAAPASERTAVAKIEKVYEGIESQGDFTGSAITVILPPTRPAKPGESLVVFGRVIAYGESLIVEANDVFEPKDDIASVDEQVKETLEANRDETLRARLQRADLVFVGTVVTDPAPVGKEDEAPGSEHDPIWRTVDVRPEEMLKGTADTVPVVFASSDDIRWFRSPKLKKSDRGLFILNAPEAQQRLPARGYLLTEPGDFRPVGEVDRIKRLLGK